MALTLRSTPVAAHADTHARVDLVELERIYRTHYATVLRLVQRLGVREEATEDVTHDVFLELGSAIANRDPAIAERAFIFGVTRHVVLRHRRQLFRHIRRREAVALEQPHDANPHARTEAARDLHALLDQLPDEQRDVFVLAELEQWTAPEIAEALSVNLNTIYSRHRAAREAVTLALRRQRAREGGKP